MSSTDSWVILNDLKSGIVEKINKIIIFGENGSEVVFSTTDGKVYKFGNNSFGKLWFGHKNAVKEPEIIVELNDKQVIDFSYGFDYVLAKTITGKLYSWGENSYGQLGIGNKESHYRPKLIDSLSDKCVIDMSCGYSHAIVLTDDHQLYGFGRNTEGQIGCGNVSNQLKPIKINGFNNETVISISCGGWHSLALTQTGSVYSWGNNRWGQLGCGNQTNIIIPIKILISGFNKIKQVVCGRNHSLILSECGDVYAFGYNKFGSLGTGNTNHSSVPVKVVELKSVTDIASHFYTYISMAKLENEGYFIWGQILSGNILKPEETPLTGLVHTFNDIMAYHSNIKVTVKPINLNDSEINLNYSEMKAYSKPKRLLDNIYDKFNDKQFSNIVFKVGDKEIFVNKFILRVNSDYFRDKYSVKSTEMTELSTETYDGIEVENIEIINKYNYEVFYAYLKYLYTDCIEIENQYLCQLLILSIDHKEEELKNRCTEKIFQSSNNLMPFESIVYLIVYSVNNNLNELIDKCIDRIKSMTTIDNVCNVYKISIEYESIELENNCFQFISGLKDKSIILKTDSYRKMSNELKVDFFEGLINQKVVN